MAEDCVIIFDGVCRFCNGSVNFIIRHDPDAVFCFAPIQSEYAQCLLKECGLDDVADDTFVLIKHGQYHIATDAVLEITRYLSGYWHLLNILRIIPGSVRDYAYRLFARNRYRLFGRYNQCLLPTRELLSRFRGFAE